MVKVLRALLLSLMLPGVAFGAALTAWPSLDPPVRNTMPASLTVLKGMATDSLYPIEVDQTDGALPIEGVAGGVPIPISGTITATNPSVSATGATVPADATYIGVNNAGNLTGLLGDSSSRAVIVGAGTAGTDVGGVLTVQGASSGTGLPVTGTFFQSTQPISAISLPLPTGASTSAKQPALGTAGTASTDVITVQGISGATPIPISGTITATNASVSTTGTAIPTSATLIGGSDGTNLRAAKVSATGLVSVDASGATVPVSGTFFQATQPVSGSGTFTTDQTAAASTFQDGAIAAGSLTTSYATVITTAGVLKHVDMRNNTNGIVVISLNGGSTTSYTLDPGDAISLDLKINGGSIATSTTLQAKYSGSAPTTGNIRIDGFY